MKKILLYILLLVTGASLAQTPNPDGSLVKWLTIEDAMTLLEQSPRPVILDFYTDWCGWCKHMKKTTYANPALANYINTYFYPITFNAEGKDTVTYLGKTFYPGLGETRSPHELSTELLKGKLMYPTTLFLHNYDKEKKEFGLNMIASGYLDQKKIEPILIYMLENVSRSTTLDEFRNYFEIAFSDSLSEKQNDPVEWMRPKDLFTIPIPLKKKSMVFIHTDWCNSCKVMKRSSFDDTLIQDYLEEKFHLVDFNAESLDTVIFRGGTFINARTAQAPFHQLATALSRNQIQFPSIVFLNENLEVIDVVPYYLSPVSLSSILKYFGDDVYKSTSWKDYLEAKNKKEN